MSGEPNEGDKNEPELFEWAGEKVTAAELAEKAKGVVSNLTKAQQENAKLKQAAAILEDPDALVEHYNSNYATNEPEVKPDLSEIEAQQLEALKPLLKKAGVVFTDAESLQAAGLLTEDVYIYDRDQTTELVKQEVRAERIFDNVESEIDGSDSRPAFKREEFVEFVSQNQEALMGVTKLTPTVVKKVYEQMHSAEVKAWREEKKAKSTEPQPPNHRGGGGGAKAPSGPGTRVSFNENDKDALTPAQAVAKMVADGVISEDG